MVRAGGRRHAGPMTTTSSEGPADDDVPRPGHDSPHDSPHDTRTLPPIFHA